MALPPLHRRLLLTVLLPALAATPEPASAALPGAVEQWGVFELALPGPTDGNPFSDVRFTTTFSDGTRAIEVAGFYDGDGVYRVRFMPDRVGAWRYTTASDRAPLHQQRGEFTVHAPSPGNHGPVRVHETYHFAYADGTAYRPFGTTCYTWTHRPEWIEEQTLRTLAASPFNKLRMCVFPQSHAVKAMPPPRFPFEGEPHRWDFTRFNPDFFRHLEGRIAQLRDLGIECDLILFHPYDNGHWGFDQMDAASDERYLRYLIARLAAYRNVWWSLANEYDFLTTKTEARWDRLFQVVQASDPHDHLRSIHNGNLFYNHTHPWVTHVSMQNGPAVEDPTRAETYRRAYRKPVVYDEVQYEGNHPQRWGALGAREFVHRVWSGTVAGTYVGHGEYFVAPDDVTWLGEGGELKGESPPRIAFLRKLLEDGPPHIDPIDRWRDASQGGRPGEYYLMYFGREAPTSWPFQLYRHRLVDGMEFAVDLIDPWEMTITPVSGSFVTKERDRYTFVDRDGRRVPLPGKPCQALRIRRVGGAVPPAVDAAPTP
ncbi:MAG TPA: DUF5060 domain-containing protein [Opitutaceae bacterium]